MGRLASDWETTGNTMALRWGVPTSDWGGSRQFMIGIAQVQSVVNGWARLVMQRLHVHGSENQAGQRLPCDQLQLFVFLRNLLSHHGDVGRFE
jgi:hypothetical protein